MANVLKMAKVHGIKVLHDRGWSNCKIALELGVDRATVGKYAGLEAEDSKSAGAPTGSGDSKSATALIGSDPKPAKALATIQIQLLHSDPNTSDNHNVSEIGVKLAGIRDFR